MRCVRKPLDTGLEELVQSALTLAFHIMVVRAGHPVAVRVAAVRGGRQVWRLPRRRRHLRHQVMTSYHDLPTSPDRYSQPSANWREGGIHWGYDWYYIGGLPRRRPPPTTSGD
jgi:hypothetical protein